MDDAPGKEHPDASSETDRTFRQMCRGHATEEALTKNHHLRVFILILRPLVPGDFSGNPSITEALLQGRI